MILLVLAVVMYWASFDISAHVYLKKGAMRLIFKPFFAGVVKTGGSEATGKLATDIGEDRSACEL